MKKLMLAICLCSASLHAQDNRDVCEYLKALKYQSERVQTQLSDDEINDLVRYKSSCWLYYQGRLDVINEIIEIIQP
jgi:hypothetical protein